jgi:hypothetical protein
VPDSYGRGHVESYTMAWTGNRHLAA